ncbi:MAG: 16S rRNA (cytosine(1402)-N(4))-methyltransferase, partial [Chitinophagaceae bacterium]|nr:16S rRNA (cytosine(1402)-N(4))-methyltransferase [Chitinophagaceae bacterium]
VKNFFRRGTFDAPESNPFTHDGTISQIMPVTKKPILPTQQEMNQNPRARSAKLRVAEKIGN